MCYEGLSMDSLVTLKEEKNEQMKKDLRYELKRVLRAMGKGNVCL